MRKIEITIHDGCIDVWEGEKHTGQLAWDEMLGQIATLTHPDLGKGKYPMLADHEWREREQRLRNRIEPTGGSNPPF